MWKTAFTAFVSAVIGGLLVFFAMTNTHLSNANNGAGMTDSGSDQVVQSLKNENKGTVKDGFSASAIYEQFGPGVVNIKSTFTKEITDFFGFRFPAQQQQQASGSGFIIDKSGIIVTNAHVVQDSNTLASKITVVLSDNEEVNAKLLGTDPSTDIAVLKIDPGNRSLKVLKLGNSSRLQVGDTVYAIGSPFELEGTMTEGIVSALNRTIESPNPNFMIRGAIQTDAAVNPGNSGGPLINSSGEVIGINSQIASSSGSFAGIAFAIPSNTVKKIAFEIEDSGKAQHAWLGIGGIELTKEIADKLKLPVSRGVMVGRVYSGSPADKAGLVGAGRVLLNDTGQQVTMGGDIIVKIGNKNVSKMDDILNFVEEHKVGDKVTFEIYRDKKKMPITLTLVGRPTEFETQQN
jgi:S1-C subfamily serine protease